MEPSGHGLRGNRPKIPTSWPFTEKCAESWDRLHPCPLEWQVVSAQHVSLHFHFHSVKTEHLPCVGIHSGAKEIVKN